MDLMSSTYYVAFDFSFLFWKFLFSVIFFLKFHFFHRNFAWLHFSYNFKSFFKFWFTFGVNLVWILWIILRKVYQKSGLWNAVLSVSRTSKNLLKTFLLKTIQNIISKTVIDGCYLHLSNFCVLCLALCETN